MRTKFSWLALAFLLGCAPGNNASDAKVDLAWNPSPPVVGKSELAIDLKTSSGQPIEGAKVRVEGNMNHAGMKPSFADLQESSPGRYSGTLDLTMGGDWFLIVTAQTADGRTIEKIIDVPGVKAQ